jgi:hypothetical protein
VCAVVSCEEELIRELWVGVPEAFRRVAQLIQFAAAFRHDLVFRWQQRVEEESERVGG